MGEDQSKIEGTEGNLPTESGDSHKEKLVDLLFNEIKRVAARKAGTYFSEFIEIKNIKKIIKTTHTHMRKQHKTTKTTQTI